MVLLFIFVWNACVWCGSDEVVELATFGDLVLTSGFKLCPALGSSGATVGNGLKLGSESLLSFV